jgi:hypothetical protein
LSKKVAGGGGWVVVGELWWWVSVVRGCRCMGAEWSLARFSTRSKMLCQCDVDADEDADAGVGDVGGG